MRHARRVRRARSAMLVTGLLAAALTLSGAGVAPAARPAPVSTAGVVPSADAPAPAARSPRPADKVAAAVRAARRGAPIPDRLRPSLRAARRDLGDLKRCDYSKNVRRLCKRGDRRDGRRRVVVLGDSHARFWIPAFEGIGWRRDWEAYYLVKEQCTAAYVLPAKNGSGAPNRACADFRRWSARMVDRLNPQLVVVSSSGPSAGIYLNGSRVRDPDRVARAMRAGWVRLFKRIKPLAPRVVLLKDVPRTGTDPLPCLRKNTRLRACLRSPAPAWVQVANQSTRAARARRVRIVNPVNWVCWRGDCPSVIARRARLPYRDRGHLTATYVRTLKGVLARDLRMR